MRTGLRCGFPGDVDTVLVERVLHPDEHGNADAWRGLNEAERVAVVEVGLSRGHTVNALSEMLHIRLPSLRGLIASLPTPPLKGTLTWTSPTTPPPPTPPPTRGRVPAASPVALT